MSSTRKTREVTFEVALEKAREVASRWGEGRRSGPRQSVEILMSMGQSRLVVIVSDIYPSRVVHMFEFPYERQADERCELCLFRDEPG
jgi:hypothetical protein